MHNGCATAGSSLAMAAAVIESGAHDLGVAVGYDKHPRGHFNADPAQSGLPQWYGDLGFMVTTQFFAMKINRYMHDFGISRATLARVAAKNYRNGALNPNAWRRKPLDEDEILESRMLNYPLTQYMFCSPDEGAAAVVLCRAADAHRYTDRPVYLRSVTLRTRKWGSFEVFAPWLSIDRGQRRRSTPRATASSRRASSPAEVDVAQVQDSESGAEIMHMAETGLCADGEQEALIAAGADRDRRTACRSTPTAVSSRTASRSARRACARCTRRCCSCGATRASARCRARLAVGFTQVYGAPGVSACTLLTT